MTALRDRLVEQFGHPTGSLGRLAGRVMARRRSNQLRNAWTLDLLGLRADDRILEIGYGPGWAIERATTLAPRIRIVGVDHSEVMRHQAARRNAEAVRRGQVDLRVGTIADLSDVEQFDKAFGVNVEMFWPDPVAVLREVARLLLPGGLVALTEQPRARGATDADVLAAGERLAMVLRNAGFEDVRVETLALKPVGAACALGIKPGLTG